MSMHATSRSKDKHIVGRICYQYLLTTFFIIVPFTNYYLCPKTKYQCYVKYIIRAYLIAFMSCVYMWLILFTSYMLKVNDIVVYCELIILFYIKLMLLLYLLT